MHISYSRRRKGDKVYEYARLVQSVRNANGTPSHKVLLTLTDWTPLQIQNLEFALKAAKTGKAVVLESEERPALPEVALSLDYLDVAVALELWRELGLDAIVDDLLAADETTVRPSDVVAALVVQRIVEPDSKLAAQRWFPRTALPELLHLPPNAFNNSRVHRTLDALQHVETELQERVAEKCADAGAFAALYLDSTDTFFVGHGPAMAKYGKTKEGRTERKIGILLLCNQRGEPLRWSVVEGRSADNLMFRETMEKLKEVAWAADVPIVVDRAMGSTADISAMLDTGLKFLTALRATEFDSYTDQIPRDAIAALSLTLREDDEREERAQLAHIVSNQRFHRVHDDLFVLDLGVQPIGADTPRLPLTALEERAGEGETSRAALRLGCRIQAELARGDFASQSEAARHYGYSKRWVQRHVKLAELPASIRRDIERGAADHLSLNRLLALSAEPAEQQQAAFAALLREHQRPASSGSRRSGPRPNGPAPRTVRQTLYFSPSLHLQRRRTFAEQVAAAYAYVRGINDDLEAGRTRQSSARLAARAEAELTRMHLRACFEVRTTPEGTLDLVENTAELAARRGRYGFGLLVGHPDLTESAEQLVALYRSKNEVERDFRLIKSVLELRPVHHRNDEKVAAHVTICILALLLTRTLDARFAQNQTSAVAGLELLRSCRLSRLELDKRLRLYQATRPTRDQLNLLKTLGMTRLVDNSAIERHLAPR